MQRFRQTAAVVFITFLTAAPAVAQTRAVQGRISTGRFDAPWGGALIRVQGSDLAVCAERDGSFVIPVPRTDVELSVEPIGYRARTLRLPAATDRLFLDLETDRVVLDEIVVTVRRDASGTAVAGETVGGAELVRVPHATLEQGLQGRMAGVEISANSGAPGGGMRTTLRGISTILGNADPLFVLDGVIVSNASIPSGRHALLAPSNRRGVAAAQDDVPNRISDLNPHDVERVEVLKGAAATAMYGSKGSNGVVLITTKRGRPQPPAAASSAFDCLLPPPG